MNKPNQLSSRILCLSLGLLFCLLGAQTRAAISYWDPNGLSTPGSGTWSTTANEWSTSTALTATPTTWNSANAAGFVAGSVNPGAIIVTVNSAINLPGFFNGGVGLSMPGCTSLTLSGSGSLNFSAGTDAMSTGSTNSTIINIPITGPGELVAEAGGQLYLNATNGYTGGTSLGLAPSLGFSGIVNFGNNYAFGTGPIIVSTTGGALAIEGTNPLTITNAVVCTNTINIVGNPAGLTFSGPWSVGSFTPAVGSGNVAANLIIIAGVISGSGGFTKDHTGIMEFTAANTYSGVTTVNNGTLQLGDGSTKNGVVAGTLTITSPGTLVWANPNAQTYGQVISGTGALTKQANGVLTLTKANTYSGLTTITSGTIKVGIANALPNGNGKGDLNLSGTLDLGAFSAGVNGLNGAGTVNNTAGAATYTLTAGNGNASGTFSGLITNSVASVALTKAGSGSLTLSGISAYSGATIINGGSLQFGASSAIPSASSILVQSAGSVDFQNLNGTVAALGGAGTFNNLGGTLDVSGNSPTVLTQNYEGFSCIAGPVSGGGTLIKDGTHAMALRPGTFGSAPLSGFSGTLTFNAGTLSVGGGPNQLPTSYALNVPSGALFQLDANSQTVSTLSGSGSINLGGGTLTVNSGGTFNGVIQNSELPGSSTAAGNGLRGYYYTNIDFTGLGAVRDDSTINFPDMSFVPNYSPTAKTNQVSVRWLGQVLAPIGGTYYFGTKCDDGSRLWVNGQLVVDNFVLQGATLKVGATGLNLAANTRYDVVLEYFNNTSGGAAGLYWSPPNTLGGNDPTNVVPSNDLFLPGAGTLVNAGSTLQLTVPSTYSGGTRVAGGTIEAVAGGALGTGNVSVGPGTSLTLDSNAGIYSSADLLVDASATAVNLTYSGTDNIHGLSLDGGATFAAAGTYGSTTSSAANRLPIFTGSGILNVSAAGTTTTLGASSTTPVYGTPITLSSTVTGSGTPTGTVTFYDNGNWLGASALVAGSASLSVSNLQVGITHSLTAVYSGDATHATSTSAVVGVNTSAATLTPTINIVTKVYDGTTTATIASLGGTLPSDSNYVYAAAGYTANFNTKDAGSQSVSVSGLSLAGSLSGNYTLSSSSYTTTGTITPKPLKVFGITASAKVYDATTAATINAAGAFLGVAEAVGTGTTADGTNYIGDDVSVVTTSAVGNFSDPNVANNKTVTITGLTLGGAQATDYSVINPTTTANITKGASVDNFTSSPNPSSQGAPVNLTATLTGNPGGTPTGSVIFAAGGVPFSTNALVSGVAATSTSTLPLGTTTLAAWYTGNTNFFGVTNTVSQVVNSTCSQTNELLSIIDNGNNTLTLHFQGTSQAQYAIVTNANVTAPIATWGTLPNTTTNLTDPNGFWSVTVPKSASGQLFYRSKAASVCP